MTAIIETYYDFNPFRVTNKVLFSDVVVFGHAASDNLIPSIEVSPFYQKYQPRQDWPIPQTPCGPVKNSRHLLVA